MSNGFICTCDPELAKTVFQAKHHSWPRGSMYRILGTLVPWTDGIIFKVRPRSRHLFPQATECCAGIHSDETFSWQGNEEWQRRHRAMIALFQPSQFEPFARVIYESAMEVAALNVRGGSELARERTVGGEPPIGANATHDLLHFFRMVALRVALRWAFGMTPDREHVGSLADLPFPGGPVRDDTPRISVSDADIAEMRRLGHAMDGLSSALFSFTGTDRSLTDRARDYYRLWSCGREIRTRLTGLVADEKHRAGSQGVRTGASDPGKPCREADNFVTRLQAAEFDDYELSNEAGALYGAHKAVAIVATYLFAEISRPEAATWREAVRQEMDDVLGDKPFPTRDDITENRLPITQRVIKETLRRNVISFGVLRKCVRLFTFVVVSCILLRTSKTCAKHRG